MKHAYRRMRPLLAALLLSATFGARAQAWRPFRPGLIYAYSGAGSSLIYTLRVDSAYVTASGDSVYAFNRLLRTSTSNNYPRGAVKSRDNLFGALVRWRPGQASYTLEALAQNDVQAAVSLELFPRAPIGMTWSASSQTARTATMVSRALETISSGVQDTVAVISLTNPAAMVRLSRRYGLLAGPQWLGGATGVQLEQALLPATVEQSVYSPLRLFDVQVGDEFGYEVFDLGVTPVQCTNDKTLRRITGRRLTADSLIITYQEQWRHQEFGYAGYCFPAVAQVTYYPITVQRWALARAGNQWQPNAGPIQPAALRLLTGEYYAGISPSYLLVGRPVGTAGLGNCGGGSTVSYSPYYLQNGSQSSATPVYATGLDYQAWQYAFKPGMTSVGEYWNGQIYSRKLVNGTIVICGSPQAFVNLLPSRAAQAATLATLHPNPAAEAAVLTLAAPARPGQTLRLTDALGRTVWTTPVAAGQTAVTVPLAGQPAGLYLLHLNGADAQAAPWKLMHE